MRAFEFRQKHPVLDRALKAVSLQREVLCLNPFQPLSDLLGHIGRESRFGLMNSGPLIPSDDPLISNEYDKHVREDVPSIRRVDASEFYSSIRSTHKPINASAEIREVE